MEINSFILYDLFMILIFFSSLAFKICKNIQFDLSISKKYYENRLKNYH